MHLLKVYGLPNSVNLLKTAIDINSFKLVREKLNVITSIAIQES
mgnify:FL=1